MQRVSLFPGGAQNTASTQKDGKRLRECASLAGWLRLLLPEGTLVLVEGRWSTGAGLTTAEAGRADIPISMVTWGDPTFDTLKAYRDLGIDRVVLGAGRQGWDDPRTTYPFIDRYAAYVKALR